MATTLEAEYILAQKSQARAKGVKFAVMQRHESRPLLRNTN